MGREFERTQRVAHFLHRELAKLIHTTVRDPRVAKINLTGVEVSRDMSYAKVYFTLLSDNDQSAKEEIVRIMQKASGFLRSRVAKEAVMRTVPRLSFRYDESVGRGRNMEILLREVQRSDASLQRESPPNNNGCNSG